MMNQDLEQSDCQTVATDPPMPDGAVKKIRLLPSHLINRIAAGEVVERPASVVKELVENALDAGAMRIDIAVGAGGRNIRVADNGCGMPPDDAAMAFYNHATSKIQQAEDLDRIETLGFRGEALASIGSISRMSCLTRTMDAPKGTRVTLDEQGEPLLSDAGCAPGTVMEVLDLFYNTPARLKFLKRPQTELSHIEEAVQFLALSHPEVRFTLALNEKEVLRTSGSGEIKKTLHEIFTLQRENIRLIPVVSQDESAGLSLAGFTSEPGVMKSSKRWIMTFVNGRHVRCPILQKAVEAAYESLLPHGRYPLCALFLNLPANALDVNVHPAKREVRYLASSQIFGFVKGGLRGSLMDYGLNLSPTTPFQATPLERIPQPDPLSSTLSSQLSSSSDSNHFEAHWRVADSVSEGTQDSAMPLSLHRVADTPLPSSGEHPVWKRADVAVGLPADAVPSFQSPMGRVAPPEPQSIQAALDFYRPSAAIPDADEEVSSGVERALHENTSLSSVLSEKASSASSRFKVIGQLFNTYILLETPQGLLVVDQHIASERTFFEALSLNLTADAPAIQRLLVPKPVVISPVQRDLLIRYQTEFERLGFLYTLDDAPISPDSLVKSQEQPMGMTEQADASFSAAPVVLHLTGYPLVYEGRDGVFRSGGLFENLLAQLEETGSMKLDLDHMIATLACHSAVRAGDTLEHDAMRLVISQWLECHLPWTCPHGRPIAHTISKSELNHFFHRPSLPVNAQ